MTAKEKFNINGFYGTKKYSLFEVEEHLEYNSGDMDVDFDLTNKVITVVDFANSIYLNIPTLKAIYKQCEELGWLK